METEPGKSESKMQLQTQEVKVKKNTGEKIVAFVSTTKALISIAIVVVIIIIIVSIVLWWEDIKQWWQDLFNPLSEAKWGKIGGDTKDWAEKAGTDTYRWSKRAGQDIGDFATDKQTTSALETAGTTTLDAGETAGKKTSQWFKKTF